MLVTAVGADSHGKDILELMEKRNSDRVAPTDEERLDEVAEKIDILEYCRHCNLCCPDRAMVLRRPARS